MKQLLKREQARRPDSIIRKPSAVRSRKQTSSHINGESIQRTPFRLARSPSLSLRFSSLFFSILRRSFYVPVVPTSTSCCPLPLFPFIRRRSQWRGKRFQQRLFYLNFLSAFRVLCPSHRQMPVAVQRRLSLLRAKSRSICIWSYKSSLYPGLLITLLHL